MGTWVRSEVAILLLEEFEDVKRQFLEWAAEDENKEDVAYWGQFTFRDFIGALVDCLTIQNAYELRAEKMARYAKEEGK